jgi:type I restriction enzyme S subunit
MNAERLLRHYEKIADTPDAIPRLRRFILELAVRGKLVAQDPNDEPAEELLKRIRYAESNRISLKKCRSQKVDQATIEKSEWNGNIPKCWKVVRLIHLGVTQTGSTPSSQVSEYFGDEIPFIKPADLGKKELNYHGDGLSRLGIPQSRLATSGSILMVCIGATLGKVNATKRDVCFNQQINSLTLYDSELTEFVALAMKTPTFQHLAWSKAGIGTLPIISKGKWEQIPIPLPPLAEQRRIVSKVDELMGLCDELESRREEREGYRDGLVRSSYGRLNETEGNDFRAAASFAIKTLGSLTARSNQIKHLRQTILNLAVRGKLVPQDPTDEPVEELLKKIGDSKKHPSGSKQSQRLKDIKALTQNDVTFEIPGSWVWTKFGDIVFSRDGERIPISKDERNQRAKIFDYYGASGVIDKIDGYLFDKPLLLIGEDGANLINRSTPIAFIAMGKYWVNNHAHVIDAISYDFLRYLELFINAIDLKPYVTGTAQPKMNQAKMNGIPVALPPEREQHRIVAKVNELNALCDELVSSLTTTDTTRKQLLESLLSEVLSIKI